MEDFLFVRMEREYIKLYFSEIVYAESLRNYVCFVTFKNKYLILTTLNHAEDILPKNQFCRVHRSYIVALSHIAGFNHDKVHLQGKEVPISEQYREELHNRIIILEGEPRTKITHVKREII